MAEDAGAQPKMVGKLVPLVWGEPGMVAFANQVIVQYDGNLVFLTFGQANPPVILGETEEEKQRLLEKIQSIVVAPVVRLVMAPENFRSVVEAFQKHLALVDKIAKQDKT
jgi:hypothetical protein